MENETTILARGAGACRAVLEAREIAHFRSEGYVLTRIHLDEAARQRAIDLVWSLLPPSFHRDQPETWGGEVEDSCHLKDLDFRRGRLKFRACVRRERWLYDMLGGNEEVLTLIAQLLGEGRVARPYFVRGLYPVFPSDAKGKKTVTGHWDQHAFQVGAVLYLDNVEAGGGGFTVWPGSHEPLGLAYRSRHNDDPMDAHAHAVEEVCRTTSPVELPGEAGTLILWHQRLLHAAGINRSRRVRQAMLGDFYSVDLTEIKDQPHDGNLWQGWAVGNDE